MTNETLQNNENLTPGQEVYTQICATYPFFNEQEERDFHSKVAKIQSNDPVEEVDQILKALNNPHTAFKKVTNTTSSNKELSEEKQPSFEIIDNVLVIKIPSWNRAVDIDKLNRILDENSDQSEGIIIDLRENVGGSDKPAFKFAKRFIPRGEYTYGTFLKRNPEEGIETIPATIESTNNRPISKPIVLFTSKNNYSACELFVAAMKAGTQCTIIGETTGGGSAFPEEYIIEINGEQYSIKIPTRRFILPSEIEPLENTHIKPDVIYEGDDIVEYAIKHIKNI